MLKWAAIFFVVMVIAGVLGFVLHVLGWFAKVAFFVCLIGFVISLVARYSRPKG